MKSLFPPSFPRLIQVTRSLKWAPKKSFFQMGRVCRRSDPGTISVWKVGGWVGNESSLGLAWNFKGPFQAAASPSSGMGFIPLGVLVYCLGHNPKSMPCTTDPEATNLRQEGTIPSPGGQARAFLPLASDLCKLLEGPTGLPSKTILCFKSHKLTTFLT